jgi:hypothetical protein
MVSSFWYPEGRITFTPAKIKERMLFKRRLGLRSPARWKGLLLPFLLAPVDAVLLDR